MLAVGPFLGQLTPNFNKIRVCWYYFKNFNQKCRGARIFKKNYSRKIKQRPFCSFKVPSYS